eukprot:1422745-Rhodomonas_salina.2
MGDVWRWVMFGAEEGCAARTCKCCVVLCKLAAAPDGEGAAAGEEGEHEQDAAAAEGGGRRGSQIEAKEKEKGRKPRVGDEVSFFILSDPTTRVRAPEWFACVNEGCWRQEER